MRFSIIIPARNEEKNIGACFDSITQASTAFLGEVEVIVVLNRCTDATEEIARGRGAKVTREDAKNLARIRNQGAAMATGEILVTIDADSRMSVNTLTEIDRALRSGKYIGGGVGIRPERWSAGIRASVMLLKTCIFLAGLAGGLYWCCRRDFEAVGGFNEKLTVAEDLDFAKRLKLHGKKRRLKFITLPGAYIVTSCRKFDRFGDWFMFRTLLLQFGDVVRGIVGKDRTLADRYFYDFER